MNYMKIQERIVHNWTKNRVDVRIQVVNEDVYIMDNDYQFFIIPKSDFILNALLFPELDMKKFVRGVEGEDGVLSGDVKVLGSSITVLKIASENNHSWVDKKLLDRFGIKKNLHFTVPPKDTHPLLVWEGEVLCGVILPVKAG